MKNISATLALALGTLLGSAQAQTVPPFINYQGRVTDSGGVGLGTGTPVNRKAIFRIYDAPSAGNRLWSEQHTVTISNGEFSVLLGNGIDAVYNSVTETPTKSTTALESVFTSAGILRYVEIVVDNGDNTLNLSDAAIAPRQQITSTAYSFRARSADIIAAGTDLQLNGSTNYGLGYYGATRLFNGTAVDGPVLFGQAGGALGSVNGGSKNIALRWNSAGAVGIGSVDLTGAAASTKLVLQGDDTNTAPMQLNIRGNADTNKRMLLGYNTTSNYGSLQAFNGFSTATNLMLNPSGGNVGIGTTTATLPLSFPNTLGGKISLWGSTSSTNYGFGIQSGTLQIHSDSLGSDIAFGYGSSAALTETMRISGTGNLTVRGSNASVTVGTAGGSDGALYFGNGSHGVKRAYSSGNDVGLYTTGGDVYLSGSGTNTSSFVLKNNGNVGIGTGSPSNKLEVNGNLKVASTIRLGSETGTSQGPNIAGLVIRRLYSSNTAVNQVVAKSNNFNLERDGTNGGLLLRCTNGVGGALVVGTGVSHNGVVVNVLHRFYTGHAINAATQLFTTGQNVNHVRLTFGDPWWSSDMTEVSMIRFNDGSGNDSPIWIGTITSTFNQ